MNYELPILSTGFTRPAQPPPRVGAWSVIRLTDANCSLASNCFVGKNTSNHCVWCITKPLAVSDPASYIMFRPVVIIVAYKHACTSCMAGNACTLSHNNYT
jgi:hypothetical protein